MKKLYLLSLIFCFAWDSKAQQSYPLNGLAEPNAETKAFIHATLVVNHQTTLTNAVLVVKGNRIIAAGNNVTIPQDAHVTDLHGFYVYPSFIDLYSNYGINWQNPLKNRESIQQFYSNKKGAFGWNEAIRAELSAADYFVYNKEQSTQMLEAGFGSALIQITDGIIRGKAAMVTTGNLPPQQSIVSQSVAMGASFSKGSSIQDYPGSAMGAVALLRQTYLDANWYAKQNTEKNLTLDAINSLKNVPVVFEAENKFAVLRAKKIADEFNANFIIKGAGDEYQRADAIKNAAVNVILPLNFPAPYEVEDPFDASFVSTTDLLHWDLAPANASVMFSKNIPFAITMHGCKNNEVFLKNLKKAVNYGLPKEQAIKALTTTPAMFINMQQELGSLTPGKLANFFITNKDLFEPDAIIHQHYTMGAKHVLKEINNIDISGKYKTNDNFIFTITPKNEVKTEKNDTLIKLTLSENYGIYTLSIAKKDTGTISTFSFWVSRADSTVFPYKVKSITGKVFLPDGSDKIFNATLIAADSAKEIPKNNNKITLTNIWYPFTDYGTQKKLLPQHIIFKNATVWTNEDKGILSSADVVVSNGKIAAVGKDLIIKDALVINAEGKHLTSGIIDEHSHIAIYRGVNECTQAITAEVSIGDVINADDINIYRQLAGGVTAVQQLHGSCNPIGGKSSIIKLRWGFEPEEMKIKSADGFIKFALGENVKQSNWGNETIRYPQTRMGVEQIITDAFYRARSYEKKLKENKTTTRQDLELEALVEILNKKRFISCHSYVQSEINMLMHVADSFGFKVNTFTHILEGYKVADKMKKHGANASTFADWWAYKYEVVDAIPQNGVILNKMGINTAINSDDAEMGRRLNQEAAKMIKYGNLNEEEAWKMVTLNPAKMLHLDNITGSVKIGKDADLVLWSANPLSIYAKAEYTLVDGIIMYSAQRDLELRNDIKNTRTHIIAKMIEAKNKGEKTEVKISEPDPDYHCEDEGW